jgi:ubiquinol-cytochrome c reductase cytochrome b subunit
MIKQGAFKWTVFRKDDISKLQTYFENNPSRSAKMRRLNLLNKYYDLKKLKAHIAPSTTLLGKSWINFLKKWENYK